MQLIAPGKPKTPQIPAGPWDNEPDATAWTDPATGLKCLIMKNEWNKTLCGYVRIMKGHRLYKANQRRLSNLEVHGGVTFNRKMQHRRYMKRGYWIGFDCAHLGDLCPGMVAMTSSFGLEAFTGGMDFGETYRDGAYVRAQINFLAFQLGRMK